MTSYFVPEKDLSKGLWLVIDQASESPTKLQEILDNKEQHEVVALFIDFREAVVELSDKLVEDCRVDASCSEDTIEDLADSITTKGYSVYVNTYYSRMALPEQEQWHSLAKLLHVFDPYYYQRFGSELEDDVDEG